MMQGEKVGKTRLGSLYLKLFFRQCRSGVYLDAIDFVANTARLLLPYYAYNQGFGFMAFQGRSSNTKSLNDLLWQPPKVNRKQVKPKIKAF